MRLVIITVFLFLSISITINCQKLLLDMESPASNFSLGEKINLRLIIYDINYDSIIRLDFKTVETVDQFSYHFEIEPNKSGSLTLGPYNMNINGKELISNTIEINVSDQDLAENEIIVNVPKIVKMNEWFEIELYNYKTELGDLILKDNQIYRKSKIFNMSFPEIENNELTRIKHFTKYKMKFVTTGDFIISKDWFDFIPEHYSIKEAIIEVK